MIKLPSSEPIFSAGTFLASSEAPDCLFLLDDNDLISLDLIKRSKELLVRLFGQFYQHETPNEMAGRRGFETVRDALKKFQSVTG